MERNKKGDIFKGGKVSEGTQSDLMGGHDRRKRLLNWVPTGITRVRSVK